MWAAAALARAGMPDSARRVLVAARAGPDIDHDRVLLLREAQVRIILGDHDDAIDLLRRYYTQNPHHRPSQTEDVAWWMRPIENDPRFQQLRTAR